MSKNAGKVGDQLFVTGHPNAGQSLGLEYDTVCGPVWDDNWAIWNRYTGEILEIFDGATDDYTPRPDQKNMCARHQCRDAHEAMCYGDVSPEERAAVIAAVDATP